MHLEPQTISTDVIKEKYCEENETCQEDIFRRVSKKIASVEKTPKLKKIWEDKFFKMMSDGGIGGGRIMASAGTELETTLLNCFVMPVGDSITGIDDDGFPGIYTALAESAETLRRGGGVGYDFSKIRPMDAYVKGTDSFASGPCSYMDVFDKSCTTVESAGCFSGDTLIDTTEGKVRIEDIVKKDGFYRALTHLGPRRITAVFNNGLKEAFLVKTKLGKEVITTIDHKYAVDTEGEITTFPLSVILEKGYSIVSAEARGQSLDLQEDWIVSAESVGVINVYDVEVEDVHLLAGNGIYTSNSRRGAMLSALRVDHPDIETFITAKRTKGRWNNFNVSVMVSDLFMESVANDGSWELVHKARPTKKLIEENSCYQREDGLWVYKTIKSRDLWEKIMKSNYDFAEPGILFEDNIDRQNNLNYVEKIIATNPCGEIPLPPYGCCDLGLVILPKLVSSPFKDMASFDFNTLKDIVQSLVRFLDNVLDATKWPIPEQKAEADRKRRLGLGFTGLGNTIAMMGFRYDDEHGREFAERIGRVISETAYRTSIELAKEKGPFPLFKADKYLKKGTFASTLAEDIQNDIRKYGIRNSHLLTCAPTGTTSLAFADNASNGIEPPFSLAYTRKKRKQHGGEEFYTVLDHSLRIFLSQMENRDIAEKIEKAICSGESTFKIGEDVLSVKKYLPSTIIGALEMSADSHLLMMASMQKYIDQSISKTINVAKDYPFEDFKDIYLKAHEYGLKGVATYRPNDILGSVLSEIKKEEPKVESAAIKITSDSEEFEIFMNKVVHQLPNDEYIAHRKKISYIGPEGSDNLYLLLSIDQRTFERDGKIITVERPVEVFIETNPDNVPSEWVDSLSRNLSLLARSGINMFIKALDNCKKAKSDKGRLRYGWIHKPDGTKVPRYHASQIDCIGFAIKEVLQKRNIINDAGKLNTLDQLFKLHSDNKVEIDTTPVTETMTAEEKAQPTLIYGKVCEECGAAAVIKKDGCSFCTNCGAEGACG